MNDNNKISVGLLIPAISVVAFVATLFNENYLGALFVAVSGLLVWFAFSAVVKAEMPDVTGNIVIVFGVLLSLAFFLNYGMDTNMFGGFEINLEGVVGSILILFFTVLMGVLYNGNSQNSDSKDPIIQTPAAQNNNNEQSVELSDDENEDYVYDYDDYDDYDDMEDLEDYYYDQEYEEEEYES